MNRLINFMGVDFKVVKENKIKSQNLDPKCYEELERIKDIFLPQDFVYFCTIIDGMRNNFIGNIHYLSYCAFCCGLDSYLFELMISENKEVVKVISFEDYIGFHPGSLFGNTVDNNNIHLYDFLCELRKKYWR